MQGKLTVQDGEMELLHVHAHAAEQGSNKLSYLALFMPAFDSMEFPHEMPRGAPAPYKGGEFSPETFILQCKIYSENLRVSG